MNVSATNSMMNTSLLNMLSSSNNDEDDIISVIQRERENQATYLEQLLGSKKTSSANGEDTTGYSNIVKSADTLQDYLEKLTASGEDSMFTKAQDEEDTSSITLTITATITTYNSMVTSMNSVGGTVYSHYGTSLQTTMDKYADTLSALGITKKSDGTLSIDEDTLGQASLTDLQSVFGEDSNFAEALQDQVKDMVSTISSALSIKESMASSYGNTGNSSYLSSVLGNNYSFFA